MASTSKVGAVEHVVHVAVLPARVTTSAVVML